MKIIKKHHSQDVSDKSLEETLFAFRRKFSELVRQEARYLKCPISQIDALVFIAGKGNPSMKEIANHLKITPPSATSIIETLQKKMLITRVMNNNDRRTIKIELTPKALKFFNSAHECKIKIFQKMLSKLKKEEKKQLIKILNILIKE